MLTRLVPACLALTLAGGVSGREMPPSACPAPAHAPEALRYAMSGTATLRFDVGPDGQARNGRIVQSSGYALLDEASLRHLASCRFGAANAGPDATLALSWTLPETARTDIAPRLLAGTCMRPYKILSIGDEGAAPDLSVRVQVWPDGQAYTAKIETPSGEALVDRAALDMVEHCRFMPATKGGVAVRSAALVNMKLNRDAYSDASLRKRYDEVAADIARQQDFRVRHMLFATEALAKEALAKLQAGADFGALAQTSTDKSSAAIGGELGWLRPTDVAPEISTALAAQGKPGLLPAAVHSRFGWHLLDIEAARPSVPPPYDDATQRILREQVIGEHGIVARAPAQ